MGTTAERPSRTPPKVGDPDVGRWGTGQVLAFCSIMALVSSPTSVVIGSLMGGAGGILMALAISWVIVLPFGSIALALVALGSIADALLGLLRRVARRSPRGPQVGGVSDEWLDGPC